MMVFIEGRGPEKARLLRDKAIELGFDDRRVIKVGTVEGFFVETAVYEAVVGTGPTHGNKPRPTTSKTTFKTAPAVGSKARKDTSEVHDV